MQEDFAESFETELEGNQQLPLETVTDQELRVRLSRPLLRKLRDTARDEGIDLSALVAELLAEGVTLRAWEIIERKGAMRGHTSGGMPPGPGNQRYGHRNHGNDRHNHHRGGLNERHGNSRYGQPQGNRRQSGQPPNNAWMEDKAAFLEYVRNQEKQRRR